MEGSRSPCSHRWDGSGTRSHYHENQWATHSPIYIHSASVSTCMTKQELASSNKGPPPSPPPGDCHQSIIIGQSRQHDPFSFTLAKRILDPDLQRPIRSILLPLEKMNRSCPAYSFSLLLMMSQVRTMLLLQGDIKRDPLGIQGPEAPIPMDPTRPDPSLLHKYLSGSGSGKKGRLAVLFNPLDPESSIGFFFPWP